MTTETLTALLVERVMHWGVAPDRFLLGNGRWMKRRRFQPTKHIQDAFRLLEKAAPQLCRMGWDEDGTFWVEVRIAGTTGWARHASKPLVISLAVAGALKIEVDP